MASKNLKQEKLREFILAFYLASDARDFNVLLQKYLREQLSGDMSSRMLALHISAS